MSEPIRYTGKTEGSLLGSPHWEHPKGEWVKWEDYARLKAEVERLTKAGDEMWKVIWLAECIAGVEHTEKSALAWNAAKEGKQS